ncbi:hypothetical protein DL767_001453 [Monosporascus sp. MG133]|nr:hypothetical protein DL767_001453 [Monosporascus sp. MG133]
MILQTSPFGAPHMIDRQGNQHGHCSDVADGDVQGQQPRLLVFETSMNIVGYSLSSWINYSVSFVGGTVTWRFPFGCSAHFSFTLFVTALWLPESPREGHKWLIAHGREKEATEKLAYVEDNVEYEWQNATRWRDLLCGRTKAAVSLPIQYVFYPETANCTPEDLDAYYRGDPSLRRRSVFAHPEYKSSGSL